MHEQRLTTRLLKHWDMVRKSHPFPEYSHFNVDPIRDLWGQCYMVSVDNRTKIKYRYEYVGEAISSAYGSDLTGHDVDDKTKQFPGVVMFKKLGEIVNEQRPKEDDGYFVSESGKLIKYRACFLPFGNEIKKITHVVVGLSFRVF